MEPEASSAVSRKPRLTRVLRTIFSSRAEESELTAGFFSQWMAADT